jgi:hypothetical protein
LLSFQKSQTHVVQALLDGYFDAIKSRDETSGRLPLHIACIFTASAQVLRMLAESYEEALRITDKIFGRLPLHFACLYGSPFEISLLVNSEQRALIFKDSSGKTPKDLAEESSNPHREAILKRLEDRTRFVTEAMIQRRKQQVESMQQHKEEAKAQEQQHSKKKNSNRRTSKASSLMTLEEIRNMNKEARRAKSTGLSDMSAEVTIRKSNSRSKLDVQDEKGSESGTKTDTNQTFTKTHLLMMRHSKMRRSFTVDDSVIAKSNKASRRMRIGQKTTSEQSKVSRRTSDTNLFQSRSANSNGKIDTNRNDKTDFQRRPSAPFSKKPDSDSSGSNGMDRLSSFLRENELSSSDDDHDYDHKSMGAKSLPVQMHASTTYHKSIFTEEKKRIVKAYMFESSNEGSMDLDDVEKSPESSKSQESISPDNNIEDNVQTELASLDSQLKSLDIRKEALTQECEAIYDTISKKEDSAQQSRIVISSLKRQIMELQERLEREQTLLSLSETGIQLQKETLAVHEIKIRAVRSEKAKTLEMKAKLEEKLKNME